MQFIFSNFRIKLLMGLALISLLAGCKQDQPFSQDYDIDWPLPTITAITPAEALIDTEITIEGTNLDRVIQVQIGSNNRTIENDDIISKSATEVVIRVPRLTETGTVTVKTNLAKSATSETSFRPLYPEAVVETWPSVIFRGQSFKISGQNMDMLTSASIGSNTLALEGGAATATEVSISVEGLDLPDEVVISLTGRNGVSNSVSPSIPVEEPMDGFIPVEPIMIWDFEGTDNLFVPADITPEYADFNGGNVIAGRGDGYFSVMESNISDPWGVTIGSMELSTPVSLSGFHEPHLTFLINTNGNQGYFQMEITQDGTRGGGHFTAANSSDSEDDYKFATDGWEWRSINLMEFGWEDWWGDGALNFSAEGTVERLAFVFKQGNGTNPFELHIDHVMFTDGPMLPAVTAFTFEDDINPYSGSANSGLNSGNVGLAMGDKYLTVNQATDVTSWNWTGEIYWDQQAVDLSQMDMPHLNLLVNTGGAKGYFQFETFQGNTKFGIGQTAPDYFFQTGGAWQMISLPLTPSIFSNWGGDDVPFDPKGVLDYLKFGFTTGNVEGEAYEISVDAVMISDGPMW